MPEPVFCPFVFCICEELNYKYMTKEEISVAYFQFPKFLLKYPISQNGKVVYMLLYDRARLSQMNNWLDENGRSYKQPLNSLYAFSYSVRSKLSRERSPRGASSCDRSSGYVFSLSYRHFLLLQFFRQMPESRLSSFLVYDSPVAFTTHLALSAWKL